MNIIDLAGQIWFNMGLHRFQKTQMFAYLKFKIKLMSLEFKDNNKLLRCKSQIGVYIWVIYWLWLDRGGHILNVDKTRLIDNFHDTLNSWIFNIYCTTDKTYFIFAPFLVRKHVYKICLRCKRVTLVLMLKLIHTYLLTPKHQLSVVKCTCWRL